MYSGIGCIETPIRHTVWPIEVADKNSCKTFERSIINQLNCSGTSANGNVTPACAFIPAQFNANPQTKPFETVDPTIYFWSDGTRRFFIFNRLQDPVRETKLAVLPFNITEWNVAAPAILVHPVINQINRFFWVQEIGASGLVLAGTDCGVVGLT